MDAPLFPRQVADDPVGARLASEFAARAEPLCPGGTPRIPRTDATGGLEKALRSAFSAGRIVRGQEGAERALVSEEKGLKNVDRKTGVERGMRVSRLLVLADDGSERFYRNVDLLLRRFAPRVVAIRLSVDQHGLARLLFGPDQVARLLLVEHKDAVSAMLLALGSQWNGERRTSR